MCITGTSQCNLWQPGSVPASDARVVMQGTPKHAHCKSSSCCVYATVHLYLCCKCGVCQCFHVIWHDWCVISKVLHFWVTSVIASHMGSRIPVWGRSSYIAQHMLQYDRPPWYKNGGDQHMWWLLLQGQSPSWRPGLWSTASHQHQLNMFVLTSCVGCDEL